MTTPLTIHFVHDSAHKHFTRELEWSGPIPAAGSVITWELDASETQELKASQWTVTSADFVTRLEVSHDGKPTGIVSLVKLVAHYGAKLPT